MKGREFFDGQRPDDIGAALLWLVERAERLARRVRPFLAKLCKIHAGPRGRILIRPGDPDQN